MRLYNREIVVFSFVDSMPEYQSGVHGSGWAIVGVTLAVGVTTSSSPSPSSTTSSLV